MVYRIINMPNVADMYKKATMYYRGIKQLYLNAIFSVPTWK